MRANIAGAILFLSSYAPLFVVFGLLGSFGDGIASAGCYAIAAASLFLLWLAFRSWRQLATTEAGVARARHRDGDAMAYVATYIVPFATLGVETWHQRAALVVFFALVGVLYIQARLFYVNPVLAMFGFRLFEVETDSGRVMLVISRSAYIRTGTTLRVHTLSDYVFLESREYPSN